VAIEGGKYLYKARIDDRASTLESLGQKIETGMGMLGAIRDE